MRHPASPQLARPRAARAGFTLIEVLFVATIFAVLMGAIGLVAMRTHGLYRTATAAREAESRARRALDRAVHELQGSAIGSLAPNPTAPTGADAFSFVQATGIAGSTVTWGPTERLQLVYEPGEADNGVDDDGDRLVDECQLELVLESGLATEKTLVLCRGVREMLEGEVIDGDDNNGNGVEDERGFSAVSSGTSLTLRISVEVPDVDDRLVARTFETSVQLRN